MTKYKYYKVELLGITCTVIVEEGSAEEEVRLV